MKIDITKANKLVETIDNIVREQDVTATADLFNMQSWYYHRSECGTAACLAGWAVLTLGDAKDKAMIKDLPRAVPTTASPGPWLGSWVPARALELLGTDDEAGIELGRIFLDEFNTWNGEGAYFDADDIEPESDVTIREQLLALIDDCE